MCPTPRSDAADPGRALVAARTVRSLLHRLGYRFRLQGADLPGHPDVVLPRWHLVVFVVDCGLYPHADCTCGGGPSSPADGGAEVRRLQQAEAELERQGWQALTVPACEADDPESLGYRLDIALQGRLIASAEPP